MNCGGFQHRLYEYLDGTLSRGAQVAAERHLSGCAACREARRAEREEGYLHVSFYPVPGGSCFGGVYFGQDKWVLHHKGWSYFDTHTRSPDYVTGGNSTSGPTTLTGPNQTLLEYLGDPVEPPADMNSAYSEDGLIKAIQTAARNADVTLQRVEIDDSREHLQSGAVRLPGCPATPMAHS